MISQTEYLRDLRHSLQEYKSETEKHFYYLENDSLMQRPESGGWSILEIIDHLNIYHFYYIDQINSLLPKIEPLQEDVYKPSWLGRKFVNFMLPEDGEVKNKMKTFNSTNPRKLQENGKKTLVAKVVFQDFIAGLDKLIKIAEESEDKNISAYKVKTYFPLVKLNIPDALGFIVAHLGRHMVQAENTMNEIV